MKQRLIGAAVLVALAVIFLPMLLEEPAPAPGAESVSLDIPQPPPREFETRDLPLQPLPADDPNRIVTVEADNRAPQDVRPEDAAPAQPPSASDSPADPEPQAPAPATAATQPGPQPEPPPAPAQQPASDGRFVVNLGSYANVGNAEALLGRLRGAGIAASAERIEIDGKPALRLRAGPYATRAEAERARLSARRVEPGLAAEVLALEASEAPATANGNFAVQVGAFSGESDANQLRDRLRAAGHPAFIDRVDTDQGRMYRVRVGPELDRARAEQLRRALADGFKLDGLIVTHP